MNAVLHVGAHHGQEIRDYLTRFDRVVYIEADPDNYAELRKHISGTPVLAIHAAISDSIGLAKLHRTSFSESHSILRLGPAHMTQFPDIVQTDSILVNTNTLNNLFGDIPDQFSELCLDIQGAELLALRAATLLLPFVQRITCEVSFEKTYDSCALMPEVDLFLSEFGFSRTGLSERGCYGDAIYTKAATV